jgi:hypothetical protein
VDAAKRELYVLSSSARSGLFYALCGFALLSLGDAIIKTIAGAWPGTAVAALRYAVGALGLGTLLFVKQGRQGFAIPMPKVQLLRGFCCCNGDHLFLFIDFPDAAGGGYGHRFYEPHNYCRFELYHPA